MFVADVYKVVMVKDDPINEMKCGGCATPINDRFNQLPPRW
jgi:hypothetical protein